MLDGEALRETGRGKLGGAVSEALLGCECSACGIHGGAVPVGAPDAIELFGKGDVGGPGHDALFIEARENADGSGGLDEINGGLEIEAKVDKVPLDVLARVLFLLEHEHVVVEELLELLVGVVDAELLEAVDLEDLEAGNVEDADEAALAGGTVEGLVDAVYKPAECLLVKRLAERGHLFRDLSHGAGGSHPLAAGLDTRAKEGIGELLLGQAEDVTDLLDLGHVAYAGLFGAVGCELKVANLEDGGSDPEEVELLIRGEADGFEDGVGLEDLALKKAKAFCRDGRDTVDAIEDFSGGGWRESAGWRLGAVGGWVGGDGGEVLDDLLCVFGLTCAGLSGDEETLVFAVVDHVAHGLVGEGKDVGSVLLASAPLVCGDDGVCVDGEGMVGVDRDEEETGVGVNERAKVALPQVVHHTGLVEEGEVGDVLDLVELGRVHLAKLKGGYGAVGSVLQGADGGFAAVLLLDDPAGDIAEGRVWDPDVLLGSELGGGSRIGSRLADAAGRARHGCS
ncbi:hypothetical protein L1887_51501 [Cichorium endivia]|nr:hypothetical protein L1887_51501 [Cichorium endivia]